jgi:hypothetical protein
MEIKFELSDEGFHKAMDDHIAKAIASISKATIEEKINQILEIQINRVEKTMVDRLVSDVIEKRLNNLYGDKYQFRAALEHAVTKIIKEILKEKL